MALSEQEKRELLSFNTGEPIVMTSCDSSDNYDRYNVVAFIRSITDSSPQYTKSVQLSIDFPFSYPDVSPIVCLNRTQLFHPNFTAKGVWLSNKIQVHESLSEYLMRLIRVIQFKEIDLECIANRNAMAWYNKHKDSELFPTDKINYNAKPRISIININENISQINGA